MTSKELFEQIINNPQMGRIDVERELRRLTNGYDHEAVGWLIQDLTDYCDEKNLQDRLEYEHNQQVSYEDEIEFRRCLWLEHNVTPENETEPPVPLAPWKVVNEPSTLYQWVMMYLKSKLQQPCCSDANPEASTEIGKDGELPREFDTPEARKLFEKMIELRYMDRSNGVFKWVARASLFGYFVDVSSAYLKLRSSNDRKPWAKYRPIITNYDSIIATAKQAVNDYDNKDLSKPSGYELIMEACGR